MAAKRHLEAVSAMTYSKLPRLEAEQGHILAADLCKSSVLPAHAPDNHYGYKGSYFAYPLQCHKGPETLTHWTPAETYTHCSSSAVSQQLKTEKAVCMLYREDAESFGAPLQPPRLEKGKDCMAREALAAQEKWATYMGHTGLVQHGWLHSFPVQRSPRGPSGCPTLAAPKPVYQNHVYCMDSGYSPKGSLALGVQVESAPQRPLDVEWTLPPSGHSIHTESQSCDMLALKKAQVPEPTFLRLQQGPKDPDPSPAGFSPYRKAFEKCRVAQSTSFLEANYPAAYSGQKTVPEVRVSSPSKHAWSKLPPPVSPLASPQTLMYQDRSPACYQLPSYPLTSHDQMLLYHPTYAQAEKQSSLFVLPDCKGFPSPGSEEPQILPRSYFPPAPRSYYPGHLEGVLYRTVSGSSTPVTPPSSNRQHEPQQHSRPNTDYGPQNPSSAGSLPEKAPYCSSLPVGDGLCDWRDGDRTAKLTKENFQSMAAQPRALQSLPSADEVPSCFGGFGEAQETGHRVSLCHLEMASTREGEASYAQKRSALPSEVTEQRVPAQKAEPGSCIVISDSPVASQDSYLKGDLPKNMPKGSGTPLHSAPDACKETATPLKRREDSPPPPSPPMPVINNVFSLAPYREYLERPAGISLSKGYRAKEPSLDNACKRVGSKQSPGPPSVESSGVLLPGRKETACNPIAEADNWDPGSNSTVTQKGSRDHDGPWESCKGELLPQNGPVTDRPAPAGGTSSLAKEDHVLDLSLKTEGVAEVPGLQKSAGKTEAHERGRPKSNGEEAKERLAPKQEAHLRLLELPAKSGPEETSHFHSSAAFLFKKFKILKVYTAGAGSTVRQSSSPLQPSSQTADLVNSFTLQQVSGQVASRQNNLPVQQSCVQVASGQKCLPVQQSTQRMGAQPSAQPLSRGCLDVTLPDSSKALPPSAQAGSPELGEVKISLSASSEPLAQKNSTRQYFTALHTSVCTTISRSVSTSAPEQLKEWLKKAEPSEECKEKVAALAKHKNSSKLPEAPRSSKGKEIWLAFRDVAALLNKLLSQLETFLLTRKCPFPHVVRAGAIFIPIHVVKEKLFPNLPSVSVDHVLQDHKVELRPTTLSEEKLLRDLELKSCTSRMLKLLALKQLPDIYTDLLNLHWHDCVKQQLGDPALGILNIGALAEDDLKATEVTRCLQSTTAGLLGQDFRGTWKQGQVCESADLPSKYPKPVDDEKSQGALSPSLKSETASTRDTFIKRDPAATLLPQENAASVDLKTKESPIHSDSKRQLFQARRRPRTLQVKLADQGARKTTSTSKVPHLEKSVVHIKFQNALQDIQGPPVCTEAGKKRKKPASLLLKSFRKRRHGARRSTLNPGHPELVGKRIRHLYEEKDKTEAWYRGVVLRVHKHHKNPLKTVFEVKYDSEPEWQYYLEILQDYKRGWVEVEE